MRVPIDGEAGIGYIMRAGFDLPPLMFSAEEAEAIAVGLSLLGRTGDAGLEKSAQSVMRKISDVMPSDKLNRDDSDNVSGHVSGHISGHVSGNPLSQSVYASGWHNIPASEIDTRVLRQSIRDQEKLSIEYLDLQSNKTTRVILPLAITYYVDAVVLAAWCELRENFRHFRTDRIQTCSPNKSYFTENGYQLREQWLLQHRLDTASR